MRSRTWADAIAGCADPRRAEHSLGLLWATEAKPALQTAKAESARMLAALLSGSQALSETLIAHPDWVPPLLDARSLSAARPMPRLRADLQRAIGPLIKRADDSAAFAQLRLFKQRETLRIAIRDLSGPGQAALITRELSDLADLCLETVYALCRRQIEERLGKPWHTDAGGGWRPTTFCMLGLGKLGGQELNYSSDVDLVFLYSDEGFVFREPPAPGETGKGVANHLYFQRLAEAIVAEVARMTPEGTLYRIDLRVRPEGDRGPLARSLASCENYYWQWGQTWERMMLIKARRVAGDAALAGEFIEMIQPFRYPRSLSRQALDDVANMKQRIENEIVRAGEIDRNVKLGRGGIREIEFVAQTLQMMHAGRHPFLAHSQTLPALAKLAEYQLLPTEDAQALEAAYLFLRDIEHRLQMDNNLQTHTIPTEREKRERLARLLGYDTLAAFETALLGHRERVRAIYERLLNTDAPQPSLLLPDLTAQEDQWKKLLHDLSFRDPEKALRLARALVQGPGFGHLSARTEKFGRQLLAQFLNLCPAPGAADSQDAVRFPDGDPHSKRLSDPDRVLARLDTFVAAYGGRALLFETWATNPSLFELIVLLFDRSEFLAETAIRTPDLVDELELSGYLRRAKNAARILKDLRHGLDDPDQKLWLRRYHQTELMRIGLRDILGLADFEQNLVELSALADACLDYALEVALRKHRLRPESIAIIGLGKLGGAELNYGSDLDVVFVADPKTRDLPGLQRAAVEVMDLLGSPTELGVAFEVDARLRPDGEKGLLVNTLDAYGDYYRQRARLWEIQAISRSRPVAGSREVGTRYRQMVATLADFSRPDTAAAPARDPDWKGEIARMRLRIEQERTPKGKEHLAIKTGAGGLVDAEFIAQMLCLARGWQQPNTLEALRQARGQGALDPGAAQQLIENYRRLRRVEGILRRWSYAGETELPDDPAPQYRVAVRCGFTNADDFLAAVGRYRQNIRAVYQGVFSNG